MYSPDVNKVELLGNLGQDPVVKSIGDKGEVVELFIATNYSVSSSDELMVDWHKVSVFGKLVDVCKDYLRKGARVYVEGKIKQNRFMDSDNKLQFRMDIVANKVLMQPGSKNIEGGFYDN